MTTQTFTAPGTLTHAHPGGDVQLTSVGGKGGVLPMFTPAGGTKAVVLSDKIGQRAVNKTGVTVGPGTIEVHVMEISGVNIDHPIEVTVNSY
jgi:hypothetical protein